MINRLFAVVFIFTLYFSLSTIAFSRNNMNLEEAVKQVKQQNNGRIISASTRRDKKQRTIHTIRLLTPQGQVKRYQINGGTGQRIRLQKR